MGAKLIGAGTAVSRVGGGKARLVGVSRTGVGEESAHLKVERRRREGLCSF